MRSACRRPSSDLEEADAARRDCARGHMPGRSAEDVIRELDLSPHPEGGWYRESFRDARASRESRPASTAIYFLLKAGEISHWHRIDATEILALACRRAAHLIDLDRWRAKPFPSPWRRSRLGRAPASRRAGTCLAKREKPRRLDARLLRGRPGLRLRRLRDGGTRLAPDARPLRKAELRRKAPEVLGWLRKLQPRPA